MEGSTPESGDRHTFQIFLTGSNREEPADTFARISDLYLKAYERYLNPTGPARTDSLKEREFSEEQTARSDAFDHYAYF